MNVGGWLGWIVRINPLTYGVAGLRHYLQNGGSEAAVLPALGTCWLVSLAFAGVMLAAAWRIAGTRSTGDFAMNSSNNLASIRHRAPSLPPSTAVPFFLALLVLVVGMAYGGWKWWQVRQYEQSRGQAILEEMSGPPLTEFELTERAARRFAPPTCAARCGSRRTSSPPAREIASG